MKDITPEQLAEMFHNIYECFAPWYGYDTKPETRYFDPKSPNGLTMIATAEAVLTYLKDEQ